MICRPILNLGETIDNLSFTGHGEIDYWTGLTRKLRRHLDHYDKVSSLVKTDNNIYCNSEFKNSFTISQSK